MTWPSPSEANVGEHTAMPHGTFAQVYHEMHIKLSKVQVVVKTQVFFRQ